MEGNDRIRRMSTFPRRDDITPSEWEWPMLRRNSYSSRLPYGSPLAMGVRWVDMGASPNEIHATSNLSSLVRPWACFDLMDVVPFFLRLAPCLKLP